MSFILSESNEFETKVEVVTPVLGGKEEVWSFTARFELKSEGSILDDLLVSVSNFSIPTPEDASEEELLRLVRTRTDSKNAIVKQYRNAVVKKNQHSSLFG